MEETIESRVVDLERRISRLEATPPAECQHEWIYTSPPHRNQRCLKCKVSRIEPEPTEKCPTCKMPYGITHEIYCPFVKKPSTSGIEEVIVDL